MKVVFLHPDLGIGGAERLVVDAGLALKLRGHSVHYVTSHHDQSHCFQETKDGTLSVTVVGNWLPRSIFGILLASCAYFKMIYAALYVVFFSHLNPDVVICDQVSAGIPFLKLGKAKILFYCHYPDQLLTPRGNFMKKLYRWPLDCWEEWTTGMADAVVVNSKFTASVFRDTFSSLKHIPLKVVYPSINFSAFDRPLQGSLSEMKMKNVNTIFLSVNRYARSKNLGLAILALERLLYLLPEKHQDKVHLVIAGGYDNRLSENVLHYEELTELTKQLHLTDHVTFLKSPTDSQKQLLLHSCTAVIYTPDKEHFGIVPLEAMYLHRPVIAVNSGGPLETVIHEETGFLCEPDADAFAKEMLRLVEDHSLAKEMGILGGIRVRQKFTFDGFTEQLCSLLDSLISNDTKKD